MVVFVLGTFAGVVSAIGSSLAGAVLAEFAAATTTIGGAGRAVFAGIALAVVAGAGCFADASLAGGAGGARTVSCTGLAVFAFGCFASFVAARVAADGLALVGLTGLSGWTLAV